MSCIKEANLYGLVKVIELTLSNEAYDKLDLIFDKQSIMDLF